MGGAGQGPTTRIVAEARAPLSVVDADGRRIEFRRPGALDRLRLFKALGPVLSAKRPVASEQRHPGYGTGMYFCFGSNLESYD